MQKAYALQYCTCHILIQKATSKNKPRIDKRAISLSKLIRSYVHVCVLFVFLCYIDDICDGVGRPKQVMFLHNAQGNHRTENQGKCIRKIVKRKQFLIS